MLNFKNHLFLLSILILIGLTVPYPVSAQSKEENAVYNSNSSLLPTELSVDKPVTEDQNVFQLILNAIGEKKDQLLGLFFSSEGVNIEKLFGQSEVLHQSNVPSDVVPSDEEEVFEQQKRFLGTPTGYWGVTLPSIADKPDGQRDIRTDETLYECGIVPCDQGVHPIVP